MHNYSFTRFILLSSACAALVGCATRSSVVPIGNGTYEATVVAGNGFATGQESIARLREKAMKEATDYCAGQGKEIKVVSVNEDKPLFKGAGLAKVKVVFKPLNAGDQELVQAAPAPITNSVQGKIKQPAVYTPPPQQYVAQPSAPQTVAQPAVPQYVAQPVAPQVERPMPALTTDELVSELTKLDDLRKKGILTDDEFQSEKKKILSRSK